MTLDRVRAVEYAPAKLTLSLRITGRRADGLHLIDAEMVSLDLVDTLEFGDGEFGDGELGAGEFSAGESGNGELGAGEFSTGEPGDGEFGAGEPGDDEFRAGRGLGAGRGLVVVDAVAGNGSPLAVGAGDDNLVVRALRAVGRTAPVRLTKRIPAGAGLGGGSADAAAVLRWAGLHGVTEEDLAVAASLGADVPFCLRGGHARVTGIGEIVEDLPCEAGKPFTLLTPPLAVSTAEAYRAWDAMGGPTADGPNDLEPAALVVEPGLAEWRDRLGDACGEAPVLAGSGSTWWVRGAYPDVAGAVVVRSVCPHRGWP